MLDHSEECTPVRYLALTNTVDKLVVGSIKTLLTSPATLTVLMISVNKASVANSTSVNAQSPM